MRESNRNTTPVLFVLVTSTFMFIAGLSLLFWDISIRSLLNDTIDIEHNLNIDRSSSFKLEGANTNRYDIVMSDSSIPTYNNMKIYDNTSTSTNTTPSGGRCLTFEESFDKLVASSSTIFLTMPAKASGSTMQKFAKQCVGGEYDDEGKIKRESEGESQSESNVFNDFELGEQFLYAQLSPPKILSSHIDSDRTMISMFQNVPRRSLIVYLHRNEHDRLFSAIRQVALSACKSPEETPKGVTLERDVQGYGNGDSDGVGVSRCTFDEKVMIDKLIRSKPKEIGMGNNQILTCNFYGAMEDNLPTMVFVHYTKADELQNVLAKYHCPELVGQQPIRINTKGDDETDLKNNLQAYIRLDDGSGTEIELGEWMEAKRDLLELTFQLRAVDRNAATCQGKTRNMEDDLLGCEDEVLEITRNTAF